MQTSEGWFAYQYRQNGKLTNIPYIRWGQAWMLLALAQYYSAISHFKPHLENYPYEDFTNRTDTP